MTSQELAFCVCEDCDVLPGVAAAEKSSSYPVLNTNLNEELIVPGQNINVSVFIISSLIDIMIYTLPLPFEESAEMHVFISNLLQY